MVRKPKGCPACMEGKPEITPDVATHRNLVKCRSCGVALLTDSSITKWNSLIENQKMRTEKLIIDLERLYDIIREAKDHLEDGQNVKAYKALDRGGDGRPEEEMNKRMILDVFDRMADAIRGTRQIRPNSRTEAFIEHMRGELLHAFTIPEEQKEKEE